MGMHEFILVERYPTKIGTRKVILKEDTENSYCGSPSLDF
jgi:hypothetical protein